MKRYFFVFGLPVLLSCWDADVPGPSERELPMNAVEPPEVLETEPGALRTEAARYEVVFDAVDDGDRDADHVPARLDADDDDPDVGAPAIEIPCSGLDEDGDGFDHCPPDLDGDGARADVDCDDLDVARHPFAPEDRCNGEDENCDGWDDCDQDGDGIFDRADPDPEVFTEPEPAEPFN